MVWLAVSRVHDISRMGDHMIHILMLFWPGNRSTTPHMSGLIIKLISLNSCCLFCLLEISLLLFLRFSLEQD